MKSRPSNQRTFYLRSIIVAIILTIAAGWILTGFLGRVAEKEFKERVDRDAHLIDSFLHDNLSDVENAAKALSQAEQIVAALASGSSADLERANRVLDRYKRSMDLSICFLLDGNGLDIASSNRNGNDGFVGKSLSFRPYFKGALAGRLTTYFALGSSIRERGYYAAAPVVDNSGAITGVVVIKRNIAPLGEFFTKYTHAFLVSPDGVIFISSREKLVFRSLWPIAESRRSELLASQQFGKISFEPLLAAEPRTGTYVSFENRELYVQRLAFGSDGWTLVLMDNPGIVSNYRLFGILLTSVFALLLLLFFIVLMFKNKSLETTRDLLKSRDDWKRTFNAVPDLIATIDSNHRIISMNRAMAERLSISPNEAAGRRCCEVVHGSQEPPLSCPHQRSLDSGKIEAETLFEKNLNGDFIVTVTPLLADDSTVESTIHVMHDVTALKQREVELSKHASLASLRAEIGGALGQNLDLPQILQQCSELMVQYLDVALFRIWTLNDAEQVLELQSSAGIYTHIDGPHRRVPVGMFKIGMIASERQPHLTNDVPNDPRIGDREWAQREGMIAFAGYPLIVADRLVGVMAAFARTTLAEDILGELAAVAGRIAQCIERKRADEALRKTELRLANAMILAQLADWEYDVAGGFFTFSDRYYTLHRTTSELEGSKLMSAEAFARKFVHPDDNHNVGEEIAKALATTDPDYHSQLEVRILRRDGEVRHVSVHIAITQNASGRTIQLHGANQDITERKQMEEALQRSKETVEEYAQRLEFVLEGSNDASWEWDLITNQAIINTRYYELTEYTPGEVNTDLGFFIKTIHPDDVSDVQKRVQDYLDGKTSGYEAHYRLVTKSGSVKDVMGRGKIVSFGEDGRPIKMAGVVTDVTEMKRLGDEVNRIHNLESIGLLAGGLAHDFNNVLNIIYGNITFVKMLANDNTAIVEPLTDAEEACERAKELGNRLQAFSQGSFPVKEPVALPAMIEHAAEALFGGSNISHTILAAEGVLPVEADSRQIRQVFENLLTNAKEAMPAGGKVKIDIENYVAAGNTGLPLESGRYVCIVIQDNGNGIAEGDLPKIFDPYFSTKDTYSQRGMGLGLSICHAILKRHRGHISVESGVGIGTGVTIYLPAS